MQVPFDLDELNALVVQSVESNDFETALHFITNFVTDIVQDSRSTANVLASQELDDLCTYIGKKSIECNFQVIQNLSALQRNLVVYIVTELYNTGGHSAVVEDLIASQPEKTHLILATDLFEQSDIRDIQDRFSYFNVSMEQAPQSGLYGKLIWLQNKLLEVHPGQIILFNHHQDTVAISAMHLGLESQIIFYHHADHQLCLGVFLDNAIHIDPHPQGFHNCRNNLGIKNNFYLPLSAKDLGNFPADRKFMVSGKIKTCSSGNQHKFEQDYRYAYSEMLPKILEITGGSHIHIGPLSEKTLADIKEGLNLYSIPPERFIHIPWVKSIWLALQEQEVDLYIESFPLGGGKTAIEVMGSGTPLIGHQNYKSRLLCCFDINYPEALFWSEPNELYNILSSITPKFLMEQSLKARKHYECYHSLEKMNQQFFNICNRKNVLKPAPLKQYYLNPMQAFTDYKKTHDTVINQLKLENTHLKLEIKSMKKSFFWRVRNHWLNLKRIFGVYLEVNQR